MTRPGSTRSHRRRWLIEREYAVYAVSYEPTGVLFPLVWDQSIDYVHAVNVTDRYTARKSGTSEAD
jgi:hypothetical protein